MATAAPGGGGAGGAPAAAKAGKKFYNRLWFRVVAYVSGGAVAYHLVDRAVFHPRVENEIVDDLLLKKGGVRKERVIVLGTGWGAGALMSRLDPLRYEIICVSPRNYFLMTPLLPSVTVGTIEPRTTVESIRSLFPWTKFVEAECLEVDPVNKLIKVAGTKEGSSSRVTKDSARMRPEFQMAYDKLVVAVGAQNNTFGTPGVEQVKYDYVKVVVIFRSV